MLGRAPLGPCTGPRSCTRSVAPQGFLRTNGATDAIRADAIGERDVYLSSVTGYDGNTGGTWKSAKKSVNGVDPISLAGDRVWVDSNHNDPTITNYGLFDSVVNPVRMVCAVAASGEPPTVLATTAQGPVGTALLVSRSQYIYGFNFLPTGSGGSPTFPQAAVSTIMTHEKCSWQLGSTSGNRIIVGQSNSAAWFVHWKDVDVKFANAAQGINLLACPLFWNGGSVLAGSTALTSALISGMCGARGSRLIASGLDLTNMGSACSLVNSNGMLNGAFAIFRNCKLPAGWTGSLSTGTWQLGARAEMYNCDSTDTNYRLWVEDAAGSTKQETTIVRTSGATDGTTPISWKMTSTAAASFFGQKLVSPERAQWNELTGSAKTLTLEIVHDSQGSGTAGRFTDAEVWLEVMYLGTAGFPLGTWISDAKANPIATAVDQADSVVAWTTTGLTTPLKQALSVSVTPQEKGHFVYRIVVAKKSVTLYVDPLLTVT